MGVANVALVLIIKDADLGTENFDFKGPREK